MGDILNQDNVRKLTVRTKPQISTYDKYYIKFNEFKEYIETFRYKELKELSIYFLDKVNIINNNHNHNLLIILLIYNTYYYYNLGKNKSNIYI